MSASIVRGQRPAEGFTLVEVLVALTLIAIALMASLRATAALSVNAYELRMRIEREWPALGRRDAPCPQVEVQLICEEEVFITPNAQFRRVEIRVYPEQGERIRLARLTGFATNQP